jgi:hypothetical protein
VAIGDLDGDSKPDLAVANQVDGSVSVLPGTGTGSFGAATNFAAGAIPNSVAIADLTGDGMLDLVTANSDSDDASVLLDAPPGGVFGKNAKVSCKVTRNSKNKVKVTCKVRLASASKRELPWSLRRHGRTIQHGVVVAHKGRATLRLPGANRLKRGHYVVRIAGRERTLVIR